MTGNLTSSTASVPMPGVERNLYPMMVDLADRLCVVVGGGAVAERKVVSLLECGARVELISPSATPHLAALAQGEQIQWRQRRVEAADVGKAVLVFAATDDAAINQQIAALAADAGAFVNVADDPQASTFHVPAALRRGDLTIAIATGGGSPALARRLRQRLEQTIGPEYESFLDALRQLRERAHAAIPNAEARQAVYRRALDSDLFELAAKRDVAAVKARIAELVQAVPAQTP